MDTQDHMNPTKEEIKLLIDNSLLQNNERMFDKFTKALDDKMTQPLNQVVTLAEEVGGLKVRMDNIWGKFIGISAGLVSLTALVTFLITKGQ
jgi:hypothetical protein